MGTISLLLRVSNVDNGADSTPDYLKTANAASVAIMHGVTLDGRTIAADNKEALWATFLAFQEAVRKIGLDDKRGGVPAPTLMAHLLGARDADASFEEILSRTAMTYADWDYGCGELRKLAFDQPADSDEGSGTATRVCAWEYDNGLEDEQREFGRIVIYENEDGYYRAGDSFDDAYTDWHSQRELIDIAAQRYAELRAGQSGSTEYEDF